MHPLRVSILGAALSVCGCEANSPQPVAATPSQPSAEAEPKKPGPPLAKDRFEPYVPKPKAPLDFSGVDVGDAPMQDAMGSLDDLGTAIVEALNAADADGLERLAITEREYKDRFFPVTIHHRSGLGLGADLAWAELHGESRGDMHTALKRYGEQSLSFVRFETQRVDARPKVKLYRRPKLVVKGQAGEERTLVMLGSILEHTPSGGFKVLAFRDTA